MHCPTCEQQIHYAEEKDLTFPLKQLRINQDLEQKTNDGVVLPYYSLVAPFHLYSGDRNEKQNGGKGEKNFTTIGRTSPYLGVMTTNKRAIPEPVTEVKKLYLSMYGYIVKVEAEKQRLLFISLSDFGARTIGCQNVVDSDNVLGYAEHNVTGLELISAVCGIKFASLLGRSYTQTCEQRHYGQDITNLHQDIIQNTTEKADAVWIRYNEIECGCYDEDLNLVKNGALLFQGKRRIVMMVLAVKLDMEHKKRVLETKFIRQLGENEEERVKTLVNQYYHGK